MPNKQTMLGCQEGSVSSSKEKDVPKNDSSTLIHVLKHNVSSYPDHVLLRWVNDKCEVTDSLTYKQLWHRSAATAELLLKNRVKKGERVMIAYPFGLEFLVGVSIMKSELVKYFAPRIAAHDFLYWIGLLYE
jgi:long-subunit acyl-CoA synthetase (AMP-forming)